jgi:ATP-dependent DNA helicase RecQ
VAFADDPGWLPEIAALQRGRASEVPAEMLDGALATLGRWKRTWSARPVAVIAAPAADMTSNVRLAQHLSTAGRLPLIDAFTWHGTVAPDDAPSTAMVSHLEQVIRLRDGVSLPPGPILLAATDMRSGWALTVAAALLREAGGRDVMALVLHQRP